MRTKTLRQNSFKFKTVSLVYSFVFGSKLSIAAILLLFMSFLIQPFHQAYANEVNVENDDKDKITTPAGDVREQTDTEIDLLEVAEDIEQITDPESEASAGVTDQDQVSESDIASSTEPAIDPQASDIEEQRIEAGLASTTDDISPQTQMSSSTSIATDTSDVESEVIMAATTSPQVVDESVDTNSSSTDSDITQEIDTVVATTTASTTDSVDSELPSETPTETPTQNTGNTADSDNSSDSVADRDSDNEPEFNDTDSSKDNEVIEVIEEIVDGEIIRTTRKSVERVVESRSLVTDENFYQFSRQSCVGVGDGTFHCSIKTDTDIDESTVVYAEIGDSQNSEIFLRTKQGEVRQLTSNEYEDTTPFYDPASLRVVWQRAVDGRQQVVLYDIEEDKEMQLTFSRTNNMEPKVSPEGIVWQAWDGNDWEIMYFDGQYTEQITDNNAQDVTPVIEDGYILWSVLGSDEQEAKVYSLDDKEILTIKGHEGGSILNPRFVLVYDTRFDNGDIVTQRFDPVTGLTAPIAAKPAPEPIDIPTPDPIGEIVALVNNKASSEDEVELSGERSVPEADNGDLNLATISKVEGDLTLNLRYATSSDLVQVMPSSASTSASIELTEFDLILTPETDTASTTEDESEELDVDTQTASSTQG